MYGLARNFGSSTDDAADDVQEIFFRVYQSLAGFDISRRFEPWLYQIALNHLRSVRRKRTRRLSRAEIVSTDQQVLDETIRGSAPGPEEEMLQAMADEDVRKALDSLPQQWREVFVLRQMQDLSGPETSRALGIPEATVRTYLHRARKSILKFVAERGWI
jgi:RNA polymerase sigma-70 factor (ECF subfamily)